MSCEKTIEHLIDFVYGELPADEARAMESHLATCAACRRAWEDLTRIGELLNQAADEGSASLPPLEPSRAFAAVRRRDVRRARRWRNAALLAVAAAVLVAALGVTLRSVEIHPTHFVIRWGEAPSPADPSHSGPLAAEVKQLRRELAESQALLARHRRRLDDLDQLAALIVAELKDDDARLAHTVAALQVRIDAVARKNDQRWQAVGRGFHDWYFAQRLQAEPADESTTYSPFNAGESP